MKKIFIVLIFLLSILTARTQNLKEWPPFNSDNNDYTFIKFIDADETSFYVETRKKENGKTFYIERHNNKTGELVYQKKIDNKIDFSFIYKNNIIVIYNELDQHSDIRTISCLVLSKENGEVLINEKMTALKAQQEIGHHSFTYGYSLSPDKSKILLVPHHTWYVHELNRLKLFDSETMNLLWENNYEQGDFSTNRFEINNNGDVIFASDQTIKIIKNKSKTINTIRINVPSDIYLKEINLKCTNDGSTIAACIYKKHNDNEPINGGVFFAKININTLKIGNQTLEDFDKLVAEKLTYKDNFESKEFPGEKGFEIVDLIENNNEWYLIAEHSVRVQGEGRFIYYTHDELIVSKLSLSGKINWIKVLPRNANQSLIDLHYLANDKKLNIIYLDHPKNIDKTTLENFLPGKIEGPGTTAKANIINISIDDEGKMTRSVIQRNKNFTLRPQNDNILLDKNTLLIYLSGSSVQRYGTISFD